MIFAKNCLKLILTLCHHKIFFFSYEANKVRSVVKEEEAQVNEKASEVREMKVEADKVL